jgi:hypothetical protein
MYSSSSIQLAPSVLAHVLRRTAAVLALLFIFPALHAWSQIIPNGTYYLTNGASGMVLDDYNNSTAQGIQNVDQYPAGNTANQQWKVTNVGNNYIYLISQKSGLALDVYGASKATGGEIDQWPYSGNSNQLWQVVSKGQSQYELISQNSGLALEDPGYNQAPSTYMDQYTVNGGSNQLWTFTPSSYNAPKLLPVMGNYEFIKGANLAWLDGQYSTYLGVDPHHTDYGVGWNYNDMSSALSNMHNMGITVVRLWLFQDDQGCTLDSNGNVTGITSQFLSNLDSTVQLAKNNNIALYMTLTTGRVDFMQNSTLLNNFINNAVIPLTKRYKGNNTIFAFDTMNEIDGDVAGNDGNYTSSGATWAQAQSYIKTVTQAIHNNDSTRLVATSSGYHAWNNTATYFQNLGSNFYDYHQYADNGYVPTVASLGISASLPIYIGESGQGSSTLSDSTQQTAENNFLYNAWDGSYAGLGIWDYGYVGATDVFHLLESNGSWRPVGETILNFNGNL